jgi:hypothetical protein
LTYAQDYETKKRLLDITDNPRITNRGEDALLGDLLSKICDRRFTLMEARRIKGISLRKPIKQEKAPSQPLETKGKCITALTSASGVTTTPEAGLVAPPPLKTALGTDFTAADKLINEKFGKGKT